MVEGAGGTFDIEIVVTRQPVQSEPRRRSRQGADRRPGDRPDARRLDAGDDQPGLDAMRDRGMPNISTMAPWQPWFIGRQADPGGGPPAWKPFDYTFHYFWGLEDIIAVFLNMWNQLDTNKVVGGLFPNDGDGNAWGDPVNGVPPAFKKAGYKTDRSRPLPEPHRRFLRADHRVQECRRRDRHRRRAAARLHHLLEPGAPAGLQAEGGRSVGKAILFPESVEVLGEAGNNLSSEVWWSPNHPFKSSLTGAVLRGARGGVREGGEPAMDAADRLHPFALRSRPRCPEARRGPEGRRCARRRDRRDRPPDRDRAR